MGVAVAALSLGAAPAASAQERICTPPEPQRICFDPSQVNPDEDPCSDPMPPTASSDVYWCAIISIGNDVAEGDLTCDRENMYLDFLICTLEDLP